MCREGFPQHNAAPVHASERHSAVSSPAQARWGPMLGVLGTMHFNHLQSNKPLCLTSPTSMKVAAKRPHMLGHNNGYHWWSCHASESGIWQASFQGLTQMETQAFCCWTCTLHTRCGPPGGRPVTRVFPQVRRWLLERGSIASFTWLKSSNARADTQDGGHSAPLQRCTG